MMIQEIVIKNRIEMTSFEIAAPLHSIWIQAKTQKNLGAMFLFYNPAQQLCGIINSGFHDFFNDIYISEKVCTLNGLYHKLQSGIYRVLIVPFYDPEKEEDTIQIEIEINTDKTYEDWCCQSALTQSEYSFTAVKEVTHRYYKGDFHGHTIFSDGHNSISEASEILIKQGMDFMAMTEHNCMAFGLPSLPCLAVPSFELTLPVGHINIHGVKKIAALYELLPKAQNYEEFLELALSYFTPDCNLSLNHMFMEPWHFTYEDFDLSKLNTLEVICDPTYKTAPAANDKAVSFLDFLWNKGYCIYGIGGSDSHLKIDEFNEGALEPSIYGDPATYVYCKGLSVQNVLEGVQKGHCYTARYVTLDIVINEGKYLPGDQIPPEVEEITWKIQINNIKKPLKGCFIRNGEIVKELRLTKKGENAEYTMKNTGEPWWLRFGIIDPEGQVIAYVNPVYNQLVQSGNEKFKQLRDEFGESYDKRNII
ncbi:CehA/McbA family metallohydrolase [Anaerocolumna sp. AGMB13025]|uniref:CehA/McbA family metallohydrolase n=1 Tax=Anaerocolumna sp. AGMB13025 TaxID=3039116 RepID=UPI00241E4D3B|nr:CehA/McbA family metallohydrolase [Anaerocolumna sp. AGMB13025]WFR58675.1 CehA/McbA family metallohydrolase [Anaerocolumna sp. AGMB13025]